MMAKEIGVDCSHRVRDERCPTMDCTFDEVLDGCGIMTFDIENLGAQVPQARPGPQARASNETL